MTPSGDPAAGAATLVDRADAALEAVTRLYAQATAHLHEAFDRFAAGAPMAGRVRGCYPFVEITVEGYAPLPQDLRLSYGFVDRPGCYRATLTRPDIFGPYLHHQFEQLLANGLGPLAIGVSDLPIPVHFAFPSGLPGAQMSPEKVRALRDSFDVPDLSKLDDNIVNGTDEPPPGAPWPLALFTAPRIDYSLHRLQHYTATSPEHFQKYVLFTNYQFYVDEFVRLAHGLMAAPDSDYSAFVEPGDRVTQHIRCGGAQTTSPPPSRLPQMPAYHLVREGRQGITLVNIGVGPSNAKTATDHIAVLRPHAWVMLGHCAGVRNTQQIGDYVLAHGYVREDHVLDGDLPTWVPIPPLAEVQQALEASVAEVTGLSDYALKRVMRTGTVATIDNRNWELRDHSEPVRRFSQSRAIALDMESATIAANGFRFRVPYGTLLCVSDKPLHGELKLADMADAFYHRQVDQHLRIGMLAMEKLRTLGMERLHSRKLRSFSEVAFQ